MSHRVSGQNLSKDQPAKPPHTWPIYLASIAVLQLAFNVTAVVLIFLSGPLLDTLGMRFGLYLLVPAVAAQFLLFPILSYGLLFALRIIKRGQEPPIFWYFMVLGLGVVVWIFVTLPLGLDVWRLQLSTQITAQTVAQVLGHGDDPVLFELPGFHPSDEPRGTYVRISRSQDGRASSSYYTVVPLAAVDSGVDRRLWLGWEDSPVDPATAGFFRVNPWNDDEYRLAVENALGEEPSDDVMILERTPDLTTARAQVWEQLRYSFWQANRLTLGALLAISIAIGLYRIRQRLRTH